MCECVPECVEGCVCVRGPWGAVCVHRCVCRGAGAGVLRVGALCECAGVLCGHARTYRALLLGILSVRASVRVFIVARVGLTVLVARLWTGGWRAVWAGCGRRT